MKRYSSKFLKDIQLFAWKMPYYNENEQRHKPKSFTKSLHGFHKGSQT